MNINRTLTAKYRGSYKDGRSRSIVGIVLHDTAGSGTHNDTQYLANPGDKRKVSVDFTVERDGSVYQLNPDLKHRWCNHAGRATNFKGLSNAAVNIGCIGIEIVQKADLSLVPLYPTEQIQSVAKLCAILCTQFDLVKSDITTHKQIIRDGSRSDPRKFPFDEFWQVYNSAMALTHTDASVSGRVTHIVRPGDTLWALSREYSVPVEEIKRLSGINSASNVLQIGQELVVKQ